MYSINDIKYAVRLSYSDRIICKGGGYEMNNADSKPPALGMVLILGTLASFVLSLDMYLPALPEVAVIFIRQRHLRS